MIEEKEGRTALVRQIDAEEKDSALVLATMKPTCKRRSLPARLIRLLLLGNIIGTGRSIRLPLPCFFLFLDFTVPPVFNLVLASPPTAWHRHTFGDGCPLVTKLFVKAFQKIQLAGRPLLFVQSRVEVV